MPNELVKQISYILYKADEEDVKVNVLLKDESIWLTQNSLWQNCLMLMFLRFQSTLKIYMNVGNWRKPQLFPFWKQFKKKGTRSVKRNVTFYNFDDIISVGYRVNSSKEIKK